MTVEDSDSAARHKIVIFADANVNGPEPFQVERIRSNGETLSFTSHSVEPRAVIALAEQLFGAQPEAYVLGIRGYAFNEFGERLSEKARANLTDAIRLHLEDRLAAGEAIKAAENVNLTTVEVAV